MVCLNCRGLLFLPMPYSPDDPTLRMDLSRVSANADRFLAVTRDAFMGRAVKVFFAAKSHSSCVILKILANRGFGCEAIRCEEVAWAKSLGMPVIVSGFVKTEGILQSALRSAEYIVVETDFELERLTDLAMSSGVRPAILLRVKTGPESKLGCSQEMIEKIAYCDTNLDIRGLHLHVGWNVTKQQLILTTLERMFDARRILQKAGRPVQILNFGGSFCECASDPDQLGTRMTMFCKAVHELSEEIHFEPGRYIVGDAGRLTCAIEYVDNRHRIIYLNTCAYGFRLTGGTPRVSLATAQAEDRSELWTLYGFWPTEGDQAAGIPIKGQPRCGDELVLENMGAYTVGLESQFALEKPIVISYV
jgi:diaminopimelate decarboxylase